MSIRKFKKVMSANRGEIAVRIFRACMELGIKTVAVYSNDDRLSLHRTKADEAYLIGKGKGPIEAYLGIDEIIELALKKEVDAIHPGYGFLSENPAFSEACEKAGIAFIGPTSQQQKALGDKVLGRHAAIAVGVPVVPGTENPVEHEEDALKFAKTHGYPIIVKAAAGGGGRGMRVAHNHEQLAEGLASAKSEAKASFGDPTVFLEKYLVKPKHIEIQIMGDTHGNIVHFFERDCSIQRRHQKVVEFAPSLALTEQMREQLCNDAIKLTKQFNYRNAGTVEFLLDQEGKHYFIEMNPRLQVEHTVTELITGRDLVQTQIRVAEGHKLSDPEIGIPDQSAIKRNGYAIQCRITTEDSENGFAPDIGTLKTYRSPAGFGVRLDAGNAFTGARITSSYDSLLVKLCGWGLTFDKAVKVVKRSLLEFRIRGVKTNIPFLENVADHPIFLAGNCDTSFIDSNPELVIGEKKKDRATKLLNYLGEVTVNGQGVVKKMAAKPQFKEADIPEISTKEGRPSGSRDLYKKLGTKKFMEWILAEKKLLVTDTTMRDAHQSLLATRVRTHDLLKIAEPMSYLGAELFSLEMWGGATFDVALRFLKESPWERLHLLREKIPNILFQMLLRGSNAVGYTNYPDNVVDRFVKEAADSGIDVFRIFDALNWTKGLAVAVEAVKKYDKICEATFCYTGDITDPKKDKYPLDYYVKLAKELEKMGANILGIKDMAGLLKPMAATKLIKALKEEVGIPVHLHTHDTSSNGGATLLRAADAGVDIVDAAVASMSGLTGQPNMNALCAALEGTERDPKVSISSLNTISNYWETVRTYYSPFESGLKSGTAEVYYHEIPGGQYSNYKPMVEGLGLGHKWEECKKMYRDVNMLFGDVIKVTPSSKIVADMAMFLVKNNLTTEDVISKAPELTFPQSVIDFFKGMIGQPYQGFPQELQKAILKGEEPITCRPGELLEPADFEKERKGLEETVGHPVNDKDLMSYLLYPHVYIDYDRHVEKNGDTSVIPTPSFLYGLDAGEEISVDIDTGKTLIVKLNAVGSSHADASRHLYFELNGLSRTVSVKDKSLETSVVTRSKADKFNKHHVGAPMPGKVFKLLVKVGDTVEEGDVIVVTEAMKMETNIKAVVPGEVKDILCELGDVIEKDDLLIVLE